MAEAWLFPNLSTESNAHSLVPEGGSHATVTSSSEGESLAPQRSKAVTLQAPSTIHKSAGMDDNAKVPFMDLNTLGLRRGGRKKSVSRKLQESQQSDPKNKELSFHNPKALMILVLSAFASSTAELMNSTY